MGYLGTVRLALSLDKLTVPVFFEHGTLRKTENETVQKTLKSKSSISQTLGMVRYGHGVKIGRTAVLEATFLSQRFF